MVIVGGTYAALLAVAGVPPLLHVLLLARRSSARRRQALATVPWLAAAAAALLLYHGVIDSPRLPSYLRLFAGFALFASPLAAFAAGWHWRGRAYPRRKVYYLIGHYAAMTAAVLFGTEAVAGVLWLASPLVALGLLLHSKAPAVPGHCAACGYDLRASPERCPECGAAAAAPAPASA